MFWFALVCMCAGGVMGFGLGVFLLHDFYWNKLLETKIEAYDDKILATPLRSAIDELRKTSSEKILCRGAFVVTKNGMAQAVDDDAPVEAVPGIRAASRRLDQFADVLELVDRLTKLDSR